MKFSASSLSFVGNDMKKLKKLDKEIGIEIFYEFASEDMWRHLLDECMEGREGEFSIHSPFFYADICYSPEKELIEELRAPFALYHRFNGSFYVLHSQGLGRLPENESERAALRERVIGRIERIAGVCADEGVTLAVENLFGGIGPLFNQQQYITLFDRAKNVRALLDVGHAVIGRYDISQVQRALGERLIGYHIHDNDGVHDQHRRAMNGSGSIDWSQFCRDLREYTPEASLVLEYAQAEPADYKTDMDKFKALTEAGV